MHVGAAMCGIDDSMVPGALAQALEARGFGSVRAPEHAHIPLLRQSP